MPMDDVQCLQTPKGSENVCAEAGELARLQRSVCSDWSMQHAALRAAHRYVNDDSDVKTGPGSPLTKGLIASVLALLVRQPSLTNLV